jgi:erythromycin esterase
MPEVGLGRGDSARTKGDGSTSTTSSSVEFEARVKEDPHAPKENAEWVKFMQDKTNYHALRSLSSVEFSDLQFLKSLLKGKRIIQLGESAHGAREFNMSKVRLIKFLHEEMGVNIVAFESPFFPFFSAMQSGANADVTALMKESIFRVWQTEEVRELFRYAQSTYKTPKPLRLVGFDCQLGAYFAENRKRPQLFREVLTQRKNKEYAEYIAKEDSAFVERLFVYPTLRKYLVENKARLIQRYDSLLRFLPDITSARQAAPEQKELPAMIAAIEARNTIALIEQLTLHDGSDTFSQGLIGSFEVRDKTNADNIAALADVLYPGEKMVVWAHNTHIRYNNKAIKHVEEPDPQYPRTTGSWLRERFQGQLYTLGLYMYRGKIAQNNRQIISVTKATKGSLESIAYRALQQAVWIDFTRYSNKTSGNSWMFEAITAKEWGQFAIYCVPREQYDGVLFVDTVNPPKYIQ